MAGQLNGIRARSRQLQYPADPSRRPGKNQSAAGKAEILPGLQDHLQRPGVHERELEQVHHEQQRVGCHLRGQGVLKMACGNVRLTCQRDETSRPFR
jgi:hypothetical protein